MRIALSRFLRHLADVLDDPRDRSMRQLREIQMARDAVVRDAEKQRELPISHSQLHHKTELKPSYADQCEAMRREKFGVSNVEFVSSPESRRIIADIDKATGIVRAHAAKKVTPIRGAR